MPIIDVDFYILSNREANARFTYACRLIEQAYFKGHRIFIECQDKKQAEDFDDLLWSFKDESFVPHNILGEGPETPPAVQIGYQQKAPNVYDTLINLSEFIPNHHQQFKRLIVIVTPDESLKEILRAHYKFYKTQGFKINNHKIDTILSSEKFTS